MTIDVEQLGNCTVALRIEARPSEVTVERDRIVKAFSKQVRIPGYRPGKVPAAIMDAKFKEDINRELTDSLIGMGLREAMREHKIEIIAVPSVTDVDLEPDLTFRFKATVAVEPQFDLPDYENIPLEMPKIEVSDQERDDFIQMMRDRSARFDDVTDRSLEMGDYAVVDSLGTQNGTPLAEVHAGLPNNVASHTGLWLRIESEVFLPGFCDGLVGMAIGETREQTISVPVDHPLRALAGETVVYSTTLRGIKRKVLPELDDAFAASQGITGGVEELNRMVTGLLTHQKMDETRDELLRQVHDFLDKNTDFDLPAFAVEQETRSMIDFLVTANTRKGVSEEQLKEKSQEIFAEATAGAKAKVKRDYVLDRIARARGITVTQKDFDSKLVSIAQSLNETPATLKKRLEKNKSTGALREQILREKAEQFLLISNMQKSGLFPTATSKDASDEAGAPVSDEEALADNTPNPESGTESAEGAAGNETVSAS